MGRLIFVYGTLKSGYTNNGVLKALNGKFVCKGSAMKFAIIDTHGAFPYMVNSTNWEDCPVGEVWELPNDASIKTLDDIEVPAGYIPQIIDVHSQESGNYYTGVIAYIYNGVYVSNGFCYRILDNKVVKCNKITTSGEWTYPNDEDRKALTRMFE